MLCCAMLCHAILCCAVLSYAVLRHATHIAHSAVQAQVVAKHISDYNIKAVKFSPYEEGRLMTCGKDSVRMFRLKVSNMAVTVSETTCFCI